MYLEYRKGNTVVFDVSNTRFFELMDFLFCNRSICFVVNPFTNAPLKIYLVLRYDKVTFLHNNDSDL